MEARNPSDMGEADVAYLQGGRKPLTTSSSVLISSSKYLNSGRMREVYAALGLQRTGHDLPEAYLVPEFGAALNELTDWTYMFRLIEDERRAKPEFAAWLDGHAGRARPRVYDRQRLHAGFRVPRPAEERL